MKRLKLKLIEEDREGKIKYRYKKVNDGCEAEVGDRFSFRRSRDKLWEVVKVTCL